MTVMLQMASHTPKEIITVEQPQKAEAPGWVCNPPKDFTGSRLFVSHQIGSGSRAQVQWLGMTEEFTKSWECAGAAGVATTQVPPLGLQEGPGRNTAPLS